MGLDKKRVLCNYSYPNYVSNAIFHIIGSISKNSDISVQYTRLDVLKMNGRTQKIKIKKQCALWNKFKSMKVERWFVYYL